MENKKENIELRLCLKELQEALISGFRFSTEEAIALIKTLQDKMNNTRAKSE